MKNLFKSWLIPSLLFVVFAQYLIRFYLLEPFLSINSLGLMMSNFDFGLLLLLSGLQIVAYHMLLKHHNTLKIPLSIKQKPVIYFYLLCALSAIIGIVLSVQIKQAMVSFIPIMTAGLIWHLVSTYRFQAILGHFVKAFLTVLVLWMVLVFEPSIYTALYFQQITVLTTIFNILGFLSLLVFFASISFSIQLERELASQGDLPMDLIKMAGKPSKKVLALISMALFVLLLLMLQVFQILSQAYEAFAYLLIFIQIPMLLSLIQFGKSMDKKKLHSAVLMNAGVLVTTVASLMVFAYLVK